MRFLTRGGGGGGGGGCTLFYILTQNFFLQISCTNWVLYRSSNVFSVSWFRLKTWVTRYHGLLEHSVTTMLAPASVLSFFIWIPFYQICRQMYSHVCLNLIPQIYSYTGILTPRWGVTLSRLHTCICNNYIIQKLKPHNQSALAKAAVNIGLQYLPMPTKTDYSEYGFILILQLFVWVLFDMKRCT